MIDNLIQLVDSLTECVNPVKVIDKDVRAFQASSLPIDGYVWPTLEGWKAQEGYRVILIEAPGAVGKSAAARQMAHGLKWPLVDASSAQVGSYSLSGLIADAVGFESDFQSRVALGKAGLVIDALDEAHLRAGSQNFSAFLENVSKAAGAPGGAGPSIILMSRPDTAAFVKASFEEMAISIASASISYFDQQQAGEFVSSCMKQRASLTGEKRYMISEGNASTFNEWRDQQFSIVASQIIGESSGNIAKNWNDVRSFLGYAPVLGVMAEFLAVPNPSKSLSIADRTFAVSSDVLLSIVDTILIREQGKFLDSTLDKLQATTSVSETLPDSQQLYSPIEQTVRLIAKIHSSSLCRNGLVALPSSVSQDYEIAAGQFLADHPFIAGSTTVNAVFGDYLLAKAATDPVCQLALSPEGRLITSDPGPFFYAWRCQLMGASAAASNSASFSAGVAQPRVCRGRSLSSVATASR